MIIRILKIISIISFLLIEGIQLHPTINLIMLLLYAYTLVDNIVLLSPISDTSWECLLIIPIIGTFIVVLLLKKYKDRYLTLLCLIALLFTAILLSGIYDQNNYQRISYSLIIPFLIFIASSLLLIVLTFRNKKD